MNVLIVTQYFWPENFRINDLAEGLSERGHTVTVLTGKPNYPEGRFYPGYHFLGRSTEKLGCIRVIRAPLIPRGKNKKLKLALNYFSFAFFASIVGLLKCRRPDVIFVYEPSPITVGLPAIVLRKWKKAPILFWVQDLWPESVVAVNAVRSSKMVARLEKFVRFIYRRCDLILTTSRAYFDPIQRLGVPLEKLAYFPQTAEAIYQPLDAAQCRAEEKQLPAGFRVLFSGNIGIAQDIETILEAAKQLADKREIQWIFLGDGSRRVALQEAIVRQGLQETVHYLGQHPVEMMPRFFACVDVLLVTLKADAVFALTIPAKIQSYLACAKPIIGALNGEGARVIEESQSGFSVPAGDAAALAAAVLQLYRLGVDQRRQLGKNGQRYFERYFKRDVLLQQLETWMKEQKERYGVT